MHEMSIAVNILKIAADELSKRGIEKMKMRELKLSVGKMMQVVPESLKYALEILGKSEGFDNALYVVIDCPLEVECKDCGFKKSLSEVDMVCAGCGSYNLKITGGRELKIDSIDVDD